MDQVDRQVSDPKSIDADRRIDREVLLGFVTTLFVAAGSRDEEAGIIADHLVESNLRGHDSHGVIRVSKYVGWVRQGAVIPNQHAQVTADRGALLNIDGGFGYGQVIGREAMA